MPRSTFKLLATFAFLLAAGACASCQPVLDRSDTPTATSTIPVTHTPVLPTTTAAATTTPTPAGNQTLEENDAAARTEICLPLEDISLEELSQPDLLKNPFDPPRPGMDDGHHGADFAYWSRGEHATMLGLPIRSVLDGQVAGIIRNRPPYGYAVIIETPIDHLSEGLLTALKAPAPAPTIIPDSSLYCPPSKLIPTRQERSLYLLYAHMNSEPSVTFDQPVKCGQVIGEVGTTGKSVNPHLHLETRVGPSGANFLEMGHYINDATESEMTNYCTWRVSGLFQMFDPMELLSLQQ